MKTNKPLVVAGLITAMTVGSIGIATASQKSVYAAPRSASLHAIHKAAAVVPLDPEAAVLAQLVTAGTITQAQSTAILAALQAAQASRPTIDGGMMGGMDASGFNLNKDISVVTTTLGITAADLQTALASGKTLAVIAGAKTADLIAALVAAETVEINARVTAGELTQAEATTLIAGLSASITTIVNSPLPMVGAGEDGNEADEANDGNNGQGDHGNSGIGLGIGGVMMGGMDSNSNNPGDNQDNQDNQDN